MESRWNHDGNRGSPVEIVRGSGAAQFARVALDVKSEVTMLAKSKLIGFVQTTDYEKARAFYEGKLGFTFVSLDQFALVMRAGAHMIRIVKMPKFTSVQGTILGWEVTDVQSAAAWLAEKGVTLEKYPFVQDKELGIWTTPNGDKVAWFKDPDGNILSISQHH
ncbi:MAG TPA: VOC family protein [Candidatus Sulfotelmatobacter sp.]|jgi:catechol 2,3-dioxygenase-like lactoylglutathione lyase family enzyme|nr:VOC family protein [Candidatus Sulfotelmatobacter sp.]